MVISQEQFDRSEEQLQQDSSQPTQSAIWHVRTLENDDTDEFIEFLGRRISDRSVRKHHQWLYRDNPHGHALTWLAVENATGKIVGCTSTFPRILNIAGKDVLASKGGDAYVDPEFRRQGIAQALHAFSVGDMQSQGIACNFGVAPVPANFRAFIRAGALSPGDFDSYRLPLDASWLTTRFRWQVIRSSVERMLNPVIRFYSERFGVERSEAREQIRVVERFDVRVDELFASVADKFGICGKRDSAYLNWRFADHPFKKFTLIECISRGKLSGYAVLSAESNRCKILDFLAADDDVGTCYFLKQIARHARDTGSRSLYLFLNPIGRYTSLFEQCGFRAAGEKLPMMVLTIGEPDNDEVLNQQEDWYLTPGDEDAT